jgi:hypothetical protein
LIGALRSGGSTTPRGWATDGAALLVGVSVDGWLVRRVTMKNNYELGNVEGRASIITTNGDHTTYYELHLGGQKFEVDEGFTDVITQGDKYRIYYVKDYNDIVTAEPLAARA